MRLLPGLGSLFDFAAHLHLVRNMPANAEEPAPVATRKLSDDNLSVRDVYFAIKAGQPVSPDDQQRLQDFIERFHIETAEDLGYLMTPAAHKTGRLPTPNPKAPVLRVAEI